MKKGIVKVSKQLLKEALHLDGCMIEGVHETTEDLKCQTVSLVLSGELMPEVKTGELIPEISVIHHKEKIKTEYQIVKRPTWPLKLETR